MAISESEACELAEMLPEGLSCEGVRERLLCLAELMRSLTDEGHRLTNSEIRAILRARFGEVSCPAENTINADLKALRTCGLFGMAVHTSPSGSWCENTQLTLAKVRLLLNAVQSSRFLTAEQSSQLQEGLLSLVSRNQEYELSGEVFVDQRTRTGFQQVFETNDLIAQAMREGRKIEFEYAFNGFDGEAHILAGDNGETVRVETPIGLVFSENNYYLESYSAVPWRHGQSIMRSRVDRMYNVRVSGQDADRCKVVATARRSLGRRVAKSTEMVDGPVRTIFLRVRADHTNIMFDKFGFGLKFGQYSGPVGDVDTKAVTCVSVSESFTFFRWLTSSAGGIVLERPASEMWLSSGPWPQPVKETPLDVLLDDYYAIRAGYLDFLDRARKVCE